MAEQHAEVLAKMFDKKDSLVTIDDEDRFQEAKLEIDGTVFKSLEYFEEMCQKIWSMVITPRKEAKGALGLKNTTNHVGKKLKPQ